MIQSLAPGKDVKFATPAHAGGYGEYMRVQLHAIAAGVGLTYELLTGDLSQVNYSSIRAGLLEFRRRMEALQWQLLVPGLCRPVWQRFVATSQAIGALPDGVIDAEWTAPRFEAVDPLKDIQADILAVRAGLMTLKEAIARQGYDPAQVLAEIGETNAALDALTDPRKATKTGAAKPMEETPECRQRLSVANRSGGSASDAEHRSVTPMPMRRKAHPSAYPRDQRHGGLEDDLSASRRVGETMVEGEDLERVAATLRQSRVVATVQVLQRDRRASADNSRYRARASGR